VVLTVVTQCDLVDTYKRFGGHYCFHLQGERIVPFET
jgi:hypothetical protein